MKKNQKEIFVTDQGIIKTILANKNIPSGAKVVLLNLLFRSGNKNYSFPTQRKISEDVGLCEKQVRNHLSLLKKMGYINWTKGAFNPVTKTMVNSNSYYLGNVQRRKMV